MTARLVRQHIAARLGVAGGALGVLAGVLQATVGAHLGGWSGSKASPVALGLLTVLLSTVAMAAAAALRTAADMTAARRAVAAIGLLVPAGLCFSTVGRLWYLPGALLLASSGFTLAAGDLGELRAVVGENWTRGLIGLLGAFEILMAGSAGPVLTVAVGVGGALVLLAVLWAPGWPRRATLVLLVVGTVPFAALTWWSVASPLLALVALAIGVAGSGLRRPSGSGQARRQPAVAR